MSGESPKGPAAGVYDFAAIEAKWQRFWDEYGTFRASNPGEAGFNAARPKCYVLDMFPYPSGSGLHVGHPLGYCATDIYVRYKRMRGFNVLHPMGYDAFGLPAEQYAIETGVHPAITTRKNIEAYHHQLKMLGLSYDWNRELATCDPSYYRWTQWIFLRLFNSWYDESAEGTDESGRRYRGMAQPIETLVELLQSGEAGVDDALGVVRGGEKRAGRPCRNWSELCDADKRQVLDNQRLAYTAEVDVNWCPALGTVLANEEVTAEGRSDRGNHPVFRRPLKQWMLRITRFADRLLADLEQLDWPEPIKLMQRNWIGRSAGAEVDFPVVSGGEGCPTVGDEAAWRTQRRQSGFAAKPEGFTIRVYTTRPDTLYGATYMVLAPEHELVEQITTDEQRAEVEAYVAKVRHKSEMERTAESKEKTGVFTGAYAMNPVNGAHVPIWVADYVLAGYGTGAIMAVAGSDTRDFEFACAFDLPIRAVVRPTPEWIEERVTCLVAPIEGVAEHRLAELEDQFPDMADDIAKVRQRSGNLGAQTRDVAFAKVGVERLTGHYLRHPRSWGAAHVEYSTAANSPEPGEAAGAGFELCDLNGLPTEEAKTQIIAWLEQNGLGRGAVNYKLRDWIFSRQKYWGEPFPVVFGPDGQMTGLTDDELPLELPEIEDYKPTPVADNSAALPEPPLCRAKDWIEFERDGQRWRRDSNTMPQWAGSCWYYLRFCDPSNNAEGWSRAAENYWMPVDLYVGGAEHAVLHLLYARFWHKLLFDLGYVSTVEPFGKLINQGMIQAYAFKDRRGAVVAVDKARELDNEKFEHVETGEPLTRVVAKISKSLKNVVRPDDVVAEFGTDAFRLYEMFMGPIDASKPWNTRDVPGVYRLLSRIWRLVVDERTGELSPALCEAEPDAGLLRHLHKTIRKIGEDIEAFKFNTAIGQMFDYVNQVTPLAQRPRKVIEPFVLLLAPFAPHLAEELWQRLGHEHTLAYEPWPAYDEKLAADDVVEIPVQINGKLRAKITAAPDASGDQLMEAALADERVQVAMEGKQVRKVITVPGRLVNIVCG